LGQKTLGFFKIKNTPYETGFYLLHDYYIYIYIHSILCSFYLPGVSQPQDDEEQMKVAFEALEAADPKDLDRAVLAQTGMRKRKQCPKHWQPERFKGIVQKL
jgi:hypothetical protein